MKKSSISTKIKIIGIFFILLMSSIVITTIYLNNKNEKDAMIINIAGKQRMLTQNISKNIFYLYSNPTASLNELNSSIEEFIYNLQSLRGDHNLLKLKKAPTFQIDQQTTLVEKLWIDFYADVSEFKELIVKNPSKKELSTLVEAIYTKNTKLLHEVDGLVSLHTIYSENKISFLKNIQYLFALLMVLLIIYSFLELKTMEKNALKFIEKSRKIMEQNLEEPLEPLKINAEEELVEASNLFNNFLHKVNAAMVDSNNAIVQSKKASVKLEELTNEFDLIIDELKNSKEVSLQLNKSEDIAIQTQEYLIKSTKRLDELKNGIERIMKSCEKKNDT